MTCPGVSEFRSCHCPLHGFLNIPSHGSHTPYFSLGLMMEVSEGVISCTVRGLPAAQLFDLTSSKTAQPWGFEEGTTHFCFYHSLFPLFSEH